MRARSIALLALAGLSVALAALLPQEIDRRANPVYDGGLPRDLTRRERELHRSLMVFDLHADTLLWRRDVTHSSGRGHLDLPRLVQGNVALQVFSVVTKVMYRRVERDAAGREAGCRHVDALDGTAWLRLVQGRPPAEWTSGEAAALGQAALLTRMIEETAARQARRPDEPALKLVRTAQDLERLIEARRQGRPIVGALLALEGTHWVADAGSDVPAIAAATRRLFDAGFRMAGPIHRADSPLGASSEGCGGGPALTGAGRRFIEAVEQRGMVIDLAHADERALQEAAKGRAGPVVVSHTGVRRLCAKGGCRIARNLADEDIRAVARTGGIVGIGYWPGAVGTRASRIADAFEAALDVLREPAFLAEMRKGGRHYDPYEHLALGSDFDGATRMPFDAAGLGGLIATLARRPSAFDARSLGLIAGGNACRVLALRLPGGGTEAARRICA